MPKPPEPRPKSPSRPSIPDDPPKGPDNKRRSSPELPPAEPLAEVERALSILQGRHPDAVRAERESILALASRKAESEARAARAHAAERRRRVVLGVAGIALAGAAFAAWTAYARRAERAKAVETALGPLLAPYLAHGFSRLAPSWRAQESIEAVTEEPTCYLALAARAPGDGALIVDRPGGSLHGAASVAWCTCAAEKDTVRLADPSVGGLAVLRVGAAEVGGDHGLAFLDPVPAVLAPPDECSRDALDAWIDKGAAVRPKDDALDADLRVSLAHLGFAPAGSVLPRLPFGAVPGEAEVCAVAWSTAPDDVLSLRLPGGARPLGERKGPLGFCLSHATNVTMWRKGGGEVVVERVAAARVGGTHGLAEVIERVGLPKVTSWVSDVDRPWDAAATLRASGIAPPEIASSSDGRPVTHARLVALSLLEATVRPELREGAGFVCEPPLTPTSSSATCVQSAALGWQVLSPAGKAGIAESPLPFWMQAFSGATDPAALTAQVGLVALGRRLAGEGFDATTLEGVTEAEGGAKIVGRAGDDAIVALQLTRESPWVSPCATGEAWKLGGDPAVVSLTPGATVKVACAPSVPAGKDRRTVVFRHVTAK